MVRSSASLVVLCAALAAPLVAQGSQVRAAAPSPLPPAASRLLDSAIAVITRSTPRGDIPGFKAAQALLERALTAAPNDPWLLHYLGFALYREATLSFGLGRDNYGPILERADSILERSIAIHAIPESHALRSGLIGMMIGPNPLRGMTLGPKSSAQVERGVELGPNNPRVWLIRGIGAMNTPAMFGGGVTRAESYFKKAIELFANDNPISPAPRWGAHEAHIWLGQAYAKQDKKDAARAEYMRALELEPNDQWVRMSLLPALDKQK